MPFLQDEMIHYASVRFASELPRKLAVKPSIVRLHTQSPYTWWPSGRVSENLRPSYLRHVIAAAT